MWREIYQRHIFIGWRQRVNINYVKKCLQFIFSHKHVFTIGSFTAALVEELWNPPGGIAADGQLMKSRGSSVSLKRIESRLVYSSELPPMIRMMRVCPLHLPTHPHPPGPGTAISPSWDHLTHMLCLNPQRRQEFAGAVLIQIPNSTGFWVNLHFGVNEEEEELILQGGFLRDFACWSSCCCMLADT